MSKERPIEPPEPKPEPDEWATADDAYDQKKDRMMESEEEK